MNTRNLLRLFTAAALLLAAVPAMAGDVDAAMVSNTCAGCHGTHGESVGAAPVIAGMSEPYLKSAMMDYKEGTRYSTIMGRIARGYSDEEIEAMAGFFAAQTWTPGKQELDAELAGKGGALHADKGCAMCHGPVGTAPSPTVPNLAGQFAEYLYYQMRDYANPHAAIPTTAMVMRPMCQNLSDEELMSLAHFYASQQ